MVSIAFYGGIPGGISTPIIQSSEEASHTKGDTIFKPYCSDEKSNRNKTMAEERDSRERREAYLKEDAEENAKKRNNDWWKIGMFMLCLMGATGGMLWWYEDVAHPQYIGLITVGGKLEGSGMTSAIECWGKFPGCRPFDNYFSYMTNRRIHVQNNTVSLLESYHREITYIYKTMCTDSDHCQEYECRNVQLTGNGLKVNISYNTTLDTPYWNFKWLVCNQTENQKAILIPEEEMVQNDNNTWSPRGCNSTWARVKHCPADLLYGIHPIRLCVQPPFFLVKNNDGNFTNGNHTLSNCGPQISLGILDENKAVTREVNCTVAKKVFHFNDYSGQFISPIFYQCNLSLTPCNGTNSPVSIIRYDEDTVEYLIRNTVEYLICKAKNITEKNFSCVVQTFGTIGQAHIELPRKNKKIIGNQFTQYNCSINDKTELEKWKLVKSSGITPFPVTSRANTGLVRYKRDFGISAIVAAIVAATAIAASATMSYIALTETNKMSDVMNHTFVVENDTIRATEMIEKQIHILYAMVLQTHADVQLLKERQKIEETFNLIGCVERSHTFCHTGHPWNESWGQLNETTEWDDWITKMNRLETEILTTLHAAKNNLEQAMITFNTPDSIAQFGRNIWSHIANWIPGLGASIIKYIIMLLLCYVVLTSSPKILRNLLRMMSGAGSSVNRYLKRQHHQKHAWKEDAWDQDQYRIHLADATGGSEDKYNKPKCSKRSYSGGLKGFNRQPKNWKNSTERSEVNSTGLGEHMETSHLSIAIAENSVSGDNAQRTSTSLKIQSEGGNIYDCCIKAQEGTLAIPCCGFPLWLFWGLIIIMGRLFGYGLRGIAMILSYCEKGLTMLFIMLKRLCDFIGRALNPATSHVSMPQYV
uniref:Envelope glycoprotein n=1 Tax=Equine infectious anemia virus TaxID=11665 RepID=A0A6C0WWM7_9RETR|nr:env protein [Equine infectious anemia virus]